MKIKPELLMETGIYSFVGLLIYAVSLFIPLFIFIIPIPFIVLYVKRGPVWGILSNLLACLLIYFGSDLSTASILLVYTVVISHTLGFMMRQNFKVSHIILWSSVAVTVFVIMAGFFAQSLNEINMIESIRTSIDQYSDTQLSVIKELPISSADRQSAESVLKRAVEFTMVLLPSIILVFSALVSYINYYISANVLRRLGIGIIDIPNLWSFRLPKHVIIGSVLIAVLLYILQITEFGFSQELILNVYLIFTFLFMINGIAAIDFIIRSRANIFVRIILPLVILLLLGMGILYAIIGLLDLCFDLRDRLRRV